ncbi:hypothetical protein FHS43_000599 [Streptosporangium becharense]|uniref:Uncharacterized protein n=1 Tax=Streptosporangium becharense TaxID=1816182 RepID=A0A7W9IFC3_9ACTN|nr:hypothetical protein [Streptosporangium becharense]MBB2909353.1 hypothetical protein [Streptosporangium becharense]MBB5819690.1 hypothetical protein [Streptosporangium becharense]
MSEHLPYTRAVVTLDEDGTRLDTSFRTPYLSVMALGADGGRPFLHLSSREAQVVVSTTGGGPVTERDVALARRIAEAAARYLADCERLHTEQSANPQQVDESEQGKAA